MAKTQTLSFPQGASYLIPFQCRSVGAETTDWTGWRVLFVVKKNLTDDDAAALINQTIVPDPTTGYNELLLNGDETYEFAVGRYYYQAVVIDATGTVGKSEVGMFVVEETTLRANAGTYVGPNPPLNPPSTAGLIFNARQPIYLDMKLITSSGMSAAIYDPRHIQADVFDVDNHTDGIVNRVYTAVEQDKLAGIADGATANQTDAYLLARANHTGTQAIATIAGLQSALDSKGDVTALNAHINDKNNPHETTKTQVGLPNVDNTADAAKNVLSATKLTNARTINGVSFDGTANITIADSTKEPILTPGTTGQYYRGDKTWQTLNKAAVGLPNVDNTADAAKPISSAVAAALADKVDKTTTANRLYATGAAGAAELLPYATDPTADTMARRGAGGTLSVGAPTDDPHAVDRGTFNTAMGLKSDKADTTAVVNHGTNANTPRPATYGAVMWRGSVEPVFKRPNDIWITNNEMRTAIAIRNMATNPSFEGGTTTPIEVRRNLCENPNFYPNTLAPWSLENGAGGSTVEIDPTFSHYGGRSARITMGTDLTQNPDIRATTNPGSNSLPFNMQLGSRYTLTAKVKHTGHSNGVRAAGRVALFWRESVGGSYNFIWSPQTPTEAGEYDVVFTFDTPTTVYDGGIILSGQTIVAGGQTNWAAIKLENMGCVMPYFDGNYNTFDAADLVCSWTGTPGNSASVLTGQAPANTSNSHATWNKRYISTDRSSSGGKHLRVLVVRDDNQASYIYVNDYSRFGEGNIASHSTKVRVSRSVGVDVRYPGGSAMSVPGWANAVLRPANTWEEAKVVGGTEGTDWQRWIRVWTQSTSGNNGWPTQHVLLDVDEHFAVAGSYNGTYFDGSTPGFAWDGAVNSSSSSGAYFGVPKYLPLTGGVVSGDLTVTGKTNGICKTSGTGMPNGSVIGSVGDVYTDITRTNGAYKWRKDSGDNTNTGWSCIEGVVETRTVPTNAAGVNFILSRVDNMVSLNLQGMMPTPIVTGLGLIPTGFRPNSYTPGIYSSNGTVANKRCAFNTSGFSLSEAPTASASIDSPVFTYFTKDAWPTVLPGSAV